MLHGTSLIIHDHEQALTLFHRHLNGFLETVINTVLYRNAVYDHLNIVVLIAVNLHATGNLQYLTVHPDMQVAFAAHALEEFPVMPLTASHHGSKDEDFLARIVVRHHLDDLLLGVFHHRLPRHVAISLTGTGI